MKKRKIIFVIAFVLTIVIIIAILLSHRINAKIEMKKQFQEGERYLSELEYDKAIACFQNILEIEPKNKEVSFALAEAYDGNQMYAYAENIYMELTEDSEAQTEAYIKLAELYMREEKLEEAKKVLEEAKAILQDERIEELFAVANPKAPKANYDSGTYAERLKVELIAEKPMQTIYYTLDGSEPTKDSFVYDKPIILRNGQNVIKAVSINTMGYVSEIAEFIFMIEIADVEINLEEPAIERMIRDYLGIYYGEPLYNDDVAQITEMYIVSDYRISAERDFSVVFEENRYEIDGYATMTPYRTGLIKTLNDLQYMPFLESVGIAYQPELDIQALSNCKSVIELSLMGNDLDNQDINAISGMSQLQKLNLSWNSITEISMLSGLTNLEYFAIWGNEIVDITSVAPFSKLVYLDFSGNQVVDISVLSNLVNLQQLWMYSNKVQDISVLSGMNELQVLMLRDNPIANPEAIRPVYPQLIRLDVDLLNLGENRE